MTELTTQRVIIDQVNAIYIKDVIVTDKIIKDCKTNSINIELELVMRG